MKRVIALLAFLPLIFVAACGRGPTPPPVGEPSGPSEGAEVIIEGFAFHPATITIAPGTTVTWINQDSADHTVAIGGTESPRLNESDSWSHTFDAAGTFDYICGIHSSMKGQIVVH